MRQSLEEPENIPEETRAALHKDATTLPPTSAAEEERIRLRTVQNQVPYRDLTTTDGRHALSDDLERTVSHRYPRPVAAQQYNDAKTIGFFSLVVFACMLLSLGSMISPKPLPEKAASTAPPKANVIKPAPSPALPTIATPKTKTTPRPDNTIPEPPTPLEKEKEAQTPKKMRRKRKKPRKNRKPDLIRVHTQPKVNNKRNAQEIK